MKKNPHCFCVIIACIAFSQFAATQSRVMKMPAGVKATDISRHEMKPAHLMNVSPDDNTVEEASVGVKLKVKNFDSNKPAKPDWNEFMEEFHKALKDSVQGYVLQINQNGSPIGNLKWGWAKTAIDGSQAWNFNTRMHVASVSKYLTSLGVLKALKLKNLSVDTKIINYLPAYWPKGPNIDKITFRHLLTHRSGFKINGDGSDYLLMKSRVMLGVSDVGDYSGYENMNFGLCRILIPILMGFMDKNAPGGDILWDMVSIGWFKSFMQDKVFTPSGVANVGFAPGGGYKSANAYIFPFPNTSQPGWNSGDLSSVSGGAGFRLSVSEVLKVLDHARRKGDILPATEVQTALNNFFGINKDFDTPIGEKGYYKKGRWTSGNSQTEQSVIFFLPDNIEVVVFVNSSIGKAQNHVAGYVKNIYLNCFH